MSVVTAKKRYEKRFNELTHQTKKALGQNFLVSDHVIQKIVDAVKEEQVKNIVEVGPGLGALTDLLQAEFGFYPLIELDRSLVQYWSSEGYSVIEGDALQIDWTKINYQVLVSNLPYQISSSIVIDRTLDQQQCQAMVLMFQKEVAQRLRAKEKTEDYGLLTVIAQEFWDITTVCDAGPRDFNPAPKVASRVLKFKKKISNVTNKVQYLQFLKSCFKQRRRILKANLEPRLHEKLLSWLEIQKLSDKVRAEELSVKQFNQLYHFIKD